MADAVLDELVDAIRKRAPYRAMNALSRVEDPKALPRDVLAHALNIASVLGRHDEVMRLAHRNAAVAHADAATRASVAQSLATAGRGDLLTAGEIPIRASGEEPDVALPLLHCLYQAGEGERALNVVENTLKPLIKRHDLVARNALHLSAEVRGGEDPVQFKTMVRRLGVDPASPWAAYEALRYADPRDPVDALPPPDRETFPAGKIPLHYCPTGAECIYFPQADETGEALQPPPAYSPANLAGLLARTTAQCRALFEESWFKSRVDLLRRLRSRYAPDAGDPIQIVSTGRAGTTALHELLRNGPYAPSHGLVWQMAPRHRWEMLNRVLTGDHDRAALRAIAKRYLSARLSELAAGYRTGRTPVLVSHFDVIFAPVLQAAFEDITWVHLHREPAKVAHSLIAKRQFAMGQLLPAAYARTTPADGAAFETPGEEALAAHVAWYMAFTRHYFGALVASAPGGAHVEVRAESLFNGEAEAFERLRRAFPRLDLSDAAMARHFARKINEKTGHEVDEPLAAARVEEALSRYDALLDAAEVSS